MTEEMQERYTSTSERGIRQDLYNVFKECPIEPPVDIMNNLGLFINSKNMARILFMHHIYQQIVNVHGVVMDFGTRWGQNMALFAAFRGVYEPFNRHRKIIGFDTFEGFPPGRFAHEDNMDADFAHVGGLSCTPEYEKYLLNLMILQELDNPASHVKKYEICKGDVTETLPEYIGEHPETIVALAYFDFDVYEPTRVCLSTIFDRIPKGGVIAFDELCDEDSPGETTALMNTVDDFKNIKLKRLPFASRVSYFIVGE